MLAGATKYVLDRGTKKGKKQTFRKKTALVKAITSTLNRKNATILVESKTAKTKAEQKKAKSKRRKSRRNKRR